jgi:hypothetical protein
MNEEQAAHPWRARCIVGISMLLLSFIGLIVTSIWQNKGFYYWLCLTPILAISCLWLSWYLRHKKHKTTVIEIWHEILHWASMIAAVWIIWKFVSMGVLGRFEAGLVIVTILSLTTFIAGVYIDISYIVIGIALGLFALGGAFAQEYMYYFMVPIVVILAGIILWITYKARH